MPRWLIILIVVMGLLLFRLIYVKVNGSLNEMEWYVSQLEFEFSAEVDSIKKGNLQRLNLHITDGEVSEDVENALNKKLKQYERLRFLVYRESGAVIMVIEDAARFRPGDSVRVSTKEDRIRIYRDGELVGESKVTNNLRENGKPIWD